MKKIITLVLALAMAVSLFTGCGKKNNAETGESDSNKLSVVTTIFPEYDWVKEILGDKAGSTDLTMLLDNGVDLHSYQPTADDIVKISDCDLFVHVGGESDGWVESVLKNAANKNVKVINLLDVLGEQVKEEEVVEGMEAEEEESEDEDEPEYDEHVWLSLKNAETLCNAITDALAQIENQNYGDAKSTLIAAQQKAEEMYITAQN